MELIKIPNNRIGALIGPKGQTKEYIEERSGATLHIDSEFGEVEIKADEVEDPLIPMKVVSIVRAIGRGFTPEKAYQLFNDDTFLHLIDIRDYTGRRPKHIRRIKGRLIGKKGRTRSLIEEFTESDIVVHGHTVGIIGDFQSLDEAKTAVDMLLNGSEHATVYKFLERKHRERKTSRIFDQ